MKITTQFPVQRIAALGLAVGLGLASFGSTARAHDPASTIVTAEGQDRDTESIRVKVKCVERRLNSLDSVVRVFRETCTYETSGPNPYPPAVQRIRVEHRKDFNSWGGDGSQRTGRCTVNGLCSFEGDFIGAGEFEGQSIHEEGGSYWPSDTSTISGVIRVTIE